MYKSVMIMLLVHQQLSTMDKPPKTSSSAKASTDRSANKPKTQPQPIRYQSVVHSAIAGVPPLKVLAAQKVHELKRRGLLPPEQLELFSSVKNAQSSSSEEMICNDVLQRDFSCMSKNSAEQYAFDLASGLVARSGSGGRVQQKVLAIEIRDHIHR